MSDFKNDYKRAMNSIEPSPELFEKIILAAKNQEAPRKITFYQRFRLPIKVASFCAGAAAIALVTTVAVNYSKSLFPLNSSADSAGIDIINGTIITTSISQIIEETNSTSLQYDSDSFKANEMPEIDSDAADNEFFAENAGLDKADFGSEADAADGAVVESAAAAEILSQDNVRALVEEIQSGAPLTVGYFAETFGIPDDVGFGMYVISYVVEGGYRLTISATSLDESTEVMSVELFVDELESINLLSNPEMLEDFF